MRARVADDRHVAVAREADVVELNLVEARLRRGYCKVDVVLPRGARVRVEPCEAAVRVPERAVGLVHRDLGMRGRGDRILERHDAADEIDAGFVHLGGDRARVVERPCGAVVDGDRRSALHERDLPRLVLHVELERVEPVTRERQVLREPARNVRKVHRHVQPPDLLGQGCAERARRCDPRDGCERDGACGRPGRERDQAVNGRHGERGKDRERRDAPAAHLPTPLQAPRVDTCCSRHEGSGCYPQNRRIAAVVLSDATIARCLAEGRIEIDPYDESLLQPSSVDVRVDNLFRVFHNNRYSFIDVKVEQAELTELVTVDGDQPFVLHPGEFVLGSTLERIRLADDLVARLEGKSSLGRLGLLIHSTAGFIDPGWDGHVTLELSNVANLPITIYPGMKIGQISFMQMTEPAAKPYGSSSIGSKYKGQKGPTPSRYFKNFEAGE